MRSITTEGVICLDDHGLVYDLCRISFIEFEDETFHYVFRPIYEVIDLLEPPTFQGIPGIDLDLHRDEYVRNNMTPVFIEERSPAQNRENLWQLLEEQGMDRLNRLEWLMHSGSRYSGDNLFVRPLDAGDSTRRVVKLATEQLSTLTPRKALEAALEPFLHGLTCMVDDRLLDPTARKPVHALVRAVYLAEYKRQRECRVETAAQAQAAGRAPGRHRKPLSKLLLTELASDVREGRISADRAARKLGISRATFYRRMRELEG